MGQDKGVSSLRAAARDCVKEGRHTEAFLHLSHALKLDEDNCEVLSERARCSVDNLQYHFALEDAQQILQRRPDSWLGHVRLAEVYFATFNFELAAGSYQTAFQVQ